MDMGTKAACCSASVLVSGFCLPPFGCDNTCQGPLCNSTRANGQNEWTTGRANLGYARIRMATTP
jgi:hypothetical protein